MIYGFSLLFGLLSMVVLIPAIRQMLRMREINRNCAFTDGMVISSKSSMGWMWTAAFGNQDRPLIRYQSPKGAEMILEVVTGSVLPMRRYEPGQSLTVVYDRDMPGRAYAQPEMGVMKREIFLGLGALIMAIGLWVIGRVFNLPF
jgi:hypothetical protein